MADFFRALGRAFKQHRTAGVVLVVVGLIVLGMFSLFIQWLQGRAMNVIAKHTLEFFKWLGPYGSALLVVIAFDLFCAWIATRDEWIRKLAIFSAEPDTPVLAILWRPGEPVYHHTYQLTSNPSVSLQYRVCIENISLRTHVDGIEVKLEDLEPRELPCVPCHLRLMNNILPQQEAIEKFSLNREGKRFVDVIVQDQNPSTFWFLHTVLPISVVVPAQRYTFRISATSENAPRVSRKFVIERDGLYWAMRVLDD